jgi:flagellar protein FlaG
VEIQRLPLLNINLGKPLDRAKPTKPTRELAASAGQSSRTEDTEKSSEEVLISVSSTVANSNGIDLAGHHLSFSVDNDTGSTVINVFNSENGEVIKQIPPEGLLKLRKRMGEIQELLLDRKA